MINRAERTGYSPLRGLYVECLKHSVAELPLTRYLVGVELDKGSLEFKHAVYSGGAITLPDSPEMGPNIVGIPYHGIITCTLTRTDEVGNYIYTAQSKPKVSPQDSQYYRPTGITFDSAGKKLSFNLTYPDDELVEYLPDSFQSSKSIISFRSYQNNYPSWHAVQLDQKKDEVAAETIRNVGRLDKIFLDAAVQGQLPGFMSQQDPSIISFSPHDFNKLSAYPPISPPSTK